MVESGGSVSCEVVPQSERNRDRPTVWVALGMACNLALPRIARLRNTHIANPPINGRRECSRHVQEVKMLAKRTNHIGTQISKADVG